jgi:pyridoxine 4-dehydrogenase
MRAHIRVVHFGQAAIFQCIAWGIARCNFSGPEVWDPPKDAANARAMLQRAVELGIDFTDTAHVYGLDDMERLIRGALSP